MRNAVSSRLDAALVARGLAPTRSRARDLIRRGLVLVDDAPCLKPGIGIAPGQTVTVAPGALSYVSRGAEKLVAALDHFGFEPRDRVALDIGASTGGFTEVLLARGARRVYAVDVGHDQLADSLRDDARVVSLEGQDARDLTPRLVPEPVGALVADVSFISLTKALPVALALTAPGAFAVLLIKPQFEAGRAAVGKGGIVRDAEARSAAVTKVETWLAAQRWRVLGVIPSPITGGSGNEEFLLGAVRER